MDVATGTERFFGCNIHLEFTSWSQDDWEQSKRSQNDLDALLSETYAHMDTGGAE